MLSLTNSLLNRRGLKTMKKLSSCVWRWSKAMRLIVSYEFTCTSTPLSLKFWFLSSWYLLLELSWGKGSTSIIGLNKLSNIRWIWSLTWNHGYSGRRPLICSRRYKRFSCFVKPLLLIAFSIVHFYLLISNFYFNNLLSNLTLNSL